MVSLLTVVPAKGWLRTTGSRKHGLLSVDAVPGARRRRWRAAMPWRF